MSKEENKLIRVEFRRLLDKLIDSKIRPTGTAIISAEQPMISLFEELMYKLEKQQKELEQVRKFGIPIETLCAEFERLENLEDKTDELKMELEDKQKEIEENQVLIDDIKEHNIVYIDTPEFEEKFISKDKIREFIKERTKPETYNFKTISVKELQELLGEN